MDDHTVFDLEEFRALRAEIDLRIGIQNASLLLLCLLFAALAALQLSMPDRRFEIALIFSVAAGMISLFWVHGCARTLQIKTYLSHVLEPRLRKGAGWEVWHARHRVQGLLGSRWFLSTRGVLVGSQVAMIGIAWLLQPVTNPGATSALVLAGAGAVVCAVLLKRPSLSPDAYSADVRSL